MNGASKAAHEAIPTLIIQLEGDPLATIAVSTAPVVLMGRYRLLMRALWQLRHPRRMRLGVGLGSAALMLLLAFLTGTIAFQVTLMTWPSWPHPSQRASG